MRSRPTVQILSAVTALVASVAIDRSGFAAEAVDGLGDFYHGKTMKIVVGFPGRRISISTLASSPGICPNTFREGPT